MVERPDARSTEDRHSLRSERFDCASVMAAPGTVIIWLAPDFSILDWNPAAERLFGWKREEVLGRSYANLFLPESSRDAIEADFRKVLAGEPSEGFENPVRPREGSERTVLWNVSRVYDPESRSYNALAIGHDITERKRMEERLRSLTEAACAGTFEMNLVSGSLEHSPEWLAALGYQVAELPSDLGEAARELIHPDDLPSTQMRLREHLRGATEVYVSEHRLRAKSGEWRWTHDRGRVISRDATGRALLMVGVSIDISERKHSEEERERLVADLQRTLADLETLQGLLPICSKCKNVRDDRGYWHRIEEYVSAHSGATFSHAVCPGCAKRLYPEDYREMYPELDEGDLES
jgi:PAS domain S-box-containing protein